MLFLISFFSVFQFSKYRSFTYWFRCVPRYLILLMSLSIGLFVLISHSDCLLPTYSHVIDKSRDITLPTKVHIVKAMVFSVVMYGCETWIKKAENQRTDAFEWWGWRRLLRISWTARRSNQSILKEINPEYSLEGLMLKLKLQILWPLSRLIGKDPDAGKD